MKNLNPLDLLKEVAIHDFESDYYKKEGQKARKKRHKKAAKTKKRVEKRQGLLRIIEKRKKFRIIISVAAFLATVFILKSENIISVKKIAILSLCVAAIVGLIYHMLFIKPRKAEFKYTQGKEFLEDPYPRLGDGSFEQSQMHKAWANKTEEKIKKLFDEVDKLG
jgi:hypothetical protein